MVGESEASIPPLGKKRLSRGRRQMYLQIVASTVILACGIVIGAGGALLRFKDDIVPPDRFPPPVRIAGDMQERYGLTEDQTEKVKIAVAASSERMRTIFTGIREKMDAEYKELSVAMKGILTAEQFKQWRDDSERRMRRGPGRFGGRRPGPGDGPGPGGGRPPGWPGGPGGGRSGSFRSDPNGRRGPEGRKPGPGGGRSGRREPDQEGLGDRPRDPAEPNSPVE